MTELTVSGFGMTAAFRQSLDDDAVKVVFDDGKRSVVSGGVFIIEARPRVHRSSFGEKLVADAVEINCGDAVGSDVVLEDRIGDATIGDHRDGDVSPTGWYFRFWHWLSSFYRRAGHSKRLSESCASLLAIGRARAMTELQLTERIKRWPISVPRSALGDLLKPFTNLQDVAQGARLEGAHGRIVVRLWRKLRLKVVDNGSNHRIRAFCLGTQRPDDIDQELFNHGNAYGEFIEIFVDGQGGAPVSEVPHIYDAYTARAQALVAPSFPVMREG